MYTTMFLGDPARTSVHSANELESPKTDRTGNGGLPPSGLVPIYCTYACACACQRYRIDGGWKPNTYLLTPCLGGWRRGGFLDEHQGVTRENAASIRRDLTFVISGESPIRQLDRLRIFVPVGSSPSLNIQYNINHSSQISLIVQHWKLPPYVPQGTRT